MSFEACFECGIYATDRKQDLKCDHDTYSYDWKKDIPGKLDPVTPTNNDEEEA